jgi:hypothetical protein
MCLADIRHRPFRPAAAIIFLRQSHRLAVFISWSPTGVRLILGTWRLGLQVSKIAQPGLLESLRVVKLSV